MIYTFYNFRYSDLVPSKPAGSEASALRMLATSSLMSSDMYNEIRQLYVTAAQRAPEKDIDCNVQACFLKNCNSMFKFWDCRVDDMLQKAIRKRLICLPEIH